MKLTNNHIAAGRPIPRRQVIALLQSAVNGNAFRFVRQLSNAWLDQFDGDLHVELLMAQAALREGRPDRALPVLKRICNTDPEYLPAQRLLAFASQQVPYSARAEAQASVLALGGKGIPAGGVPAWGELLRNARECQIAGKLVEAEELAHQALASQSNSPLPAVYHLLLSQHIHEWLALRDLAAQYLDRWPDSLVVNLILADTLIKGGQEQRAVTLLHHAVSLDIAGQVPIRLWGSRHPYVDLWPDNPEIVIDFPIPADVATAMGWNQLPQGDLTSSFGKNQPGPEGHPASRAEHLTTDSKMDHTLQQVRAELAQLASKLKKPEIARADGRFPVYVVLTTHEGLESQYGPQHLPQIDEAMQTLVKATRALPNWDALLIYADDLKSTDKFGLPPAQPKNAWDIKTLIADLDKALARRGEMIGALLIVGGPQVVPFHHLPNPVDDFDSDVPSDNPYACTDENYFIPSWSVGRLPGSRANHPQDLLDQLAHITESRGHFRPALSIFRQLWGSLFGLLPSKSASPSFGYTAEIWRRASNSVYRPIGKPHTMVISPPTDAGEIGKRNQKRSMDLAYYNLHGLEDTSEWFGQRDPIETPLGPDYPVALRPQDIVNSGRAPQIVFSEACFGANVIDKHLEEAICLKFLASGSRAVVGSTCTSYGSITTPLIAADLLGKAFWSFLQDGYPAGEALQRAKIHLAKEMHKRQGYLDGEDQKTLISFVLYGDPLAKPHQTGRQAKGLQRFPTDSSQVKTICAKVNQPDSRPQIPDEVLLQVKNIVKEYLPGMKGAQLLYASEHSKCRGHNCPTHQLGAKSAPGRRHLRQVVTLSKTITSGVQIHNRHARITLDSRGKVVKLAVSR